MVWKMKKSLWSLALGIVLFIGLTTLLGGLLRVASNILPLVIVFIYLSFLFIGGIKGTRYFQKIQFFKMRNLWNTIKLLNTIKKKDRLYLYGIVGFSILFASKALVLAFIASSVYLLTVGVISFIVWEVTRSMLKKKMSKDVVSYLGALKQAW